MIRVIEDYVILVDTLSYKACIDTNKTDKKGKPVYKTVGYYSNLEQALKGIIEDRNARAFEAGTYSLQEALEVIKQSNKVFTDMLKEVLENGTERDA